MFPNFQNCACCEKHLKDNKHNSLRFTFKICSDICPWTSSVPQSSQLGLENTGKHGVWWKTRGRLENTGSGGKPEVWWKTRGLVENTGSGGKHGVGWKTRGRVENTRSGGKHEVWWKTRGVANGPSKPLGLVKF